MPLPKELDPREYKNKIRKPYEPDNAELNQNSYNGSFTIFDTLSFQNQIKKKQMPFTVTKLNTVHTGVFTYQPNTYD